MNESPSMSRKVYQVLVSFDGQEHKIFAAFLKEDTRPAGKRLQRFYADLRRYILPLLEDEADDLRIRKAEEKVARRLEESNSDLDLAHRRWCTKLMRKVRRFLINEELAAMPEEFEELLLLRAYSRRELFNLFRIRYTDLNRKAEEGPQGDWSYLAQFMARTMMRDTNQGGARNKHLFAGFYAQIEPLTLYYLHHLTIANSCIVNMNRVGGKSLDLIHPEPMRELAQSIDLEEHPGIRLQLDYQRFFSEEIAEEEALLFTDDLLEHHLQLDPENQLVLLHFCINLLYALARKGSHAAREKLYEVNLYALQGGFLDVNGKLPAATFKNLLFLGFQMNRRDLINELLEDYSPDRIEYFNAQQAEAMVPFTQAHLAFLDGDYREALRQVNQLATRHNLHDVQLEVAIRTLRAQLLYLTGQYDEAHSVTENFRMYINNNEHLLLNSTLEPLKLRVHWMRKLLRGTLQRPNQIEKALQGLTEAPEFRMKEWFRTELEKLVDRPQSHSAR